MFLSRIKTIFRRRSSRPVPLRSDPAPEVELPAEAFVPGDPDIECLASHAENGKELLTQFLDRLAHPRLEQDAVLSGRYRVVRFIDSGGMADVYEARDIETGAPVAIKVLHCDLSHSADHVEQFKRELVTNRAVNHSAINPTYEILHEEHPAGQMVWYLTMRYAPGPDLSERVRSGPPITARVFREWFSALAEGLGAIHAAGIIHGDVTPRNIKLLGNKGKEVPVIMDFGLARLRSGGTGPEDDCGGLGGSPGYMPPEQEAAKALRPAADVFSLGRVMEHSRSLVRMRPSQYPLWFLLQAIMRKCVREDPAKRFWDGRQLAEALRRATWQSRIANGALTALSIGCVAMLVLQAPPVRRQIIPEPPAEARYYYEMGSAHLVAGAAYAAVKSFQRALELYPEWPLALAGLAEALDETDAHRKAVRDISQALRPGTRMARADRQYLEALRAYFAQNWRGAITLLKGLRNEKNGSIAARSRVLLGKTYERSGAFDAALNLYREKNNSPTAGGELLRLAAILTDRMQLAEGRAACHKAQQSFEAATDTEGQIESYYREGFLENRYGDAARARERLEQALKLAGLVENSQQTARIYVDLAMHHLWGGDLQKARFYDDLAREMIERFGLDTVAPMELKAQGDIFLQTNDTASARRAYQAGLRLARELDAARPQAVLLVSLADVSIYVGSVAEGDAYAKDALAISRVNHFPHLISLALMFQGRAKRKQGDYASAMKAFQEELQIAQSVNDLEGKAQAEEGIASVLIEQELYPQALRIVRGVLSFAEANGEGILAGYSAVRGALLAGALGDGAAGEELLARANGLSKNNPALRGRCDFAGGELAGFAGNPGQSVQLLTRAEGEFSPEDAETRAETESYIGTQEVLLGRVDSALRRAADALAVAKRLKLGGLEQRLRVNLALVEMKTGKAAEAAALLSQSGLSSSVFPESNWRAHKILAQAYLATRKLRAAAAEDSEAQRLLALLRDQWGGANWDQYRSRADLRRDLWNGPTRNAPAATAISGILRAGR